MDLFLQITPKHPATHFPLQKKTMKNTTVKHLASVIRVIWGVNHRRPRGGFINGILSLERNFCMQIFKRTGKLAKVRISPVLPINLDFLWTLLPRRSVSCLQTLYSPRGVFLGIFGGCVPPGFSKSWPYFRLKNVVFHTSYQTRSPKSPFSDLA